MFMKKYKYTLSIILICCICSVVTIFIKNNDTYIDVSTVLNYTDIGNISQEMPAVSLKSHIFYSGKGGVMYQYNLKKNKITFICNDPTCPHTEDCASINKYMIQSDGKTIFARGNFETANASTIVYSSFGEIIDGKYQKLIEEDGMISYPSIINNRVLAEVNNKIVLMDINSGEVVKEYSFKQALSLQQLCFYENTIYYINGLGILYKIDIDTDKINQVLNRKVRKIIPVNDKIYYLAESKNEIGCVNKDGSENKVISTGIKTFNIFGGEIYYSKISSDGVFCTNIEKGTHKKILEWEDINSICIFKEEKKILCSSYENNYVSDLDGSNAKELINPERIVLND